MSWFIVAQIIGVLATVLSLLIYQVNRRSSMLWLGLAAGVLFAIHFYILGALTGAILNLIGIARSYTFVKVTPSRNNIWVLVLFIIIASVATVAFWQGQIGVLALVGNTASGIAFWQKKPKSIRRWALISPPLWFAYNALSRSYPGMFIEVMNVLSAVTGIYRFDRKSTIKIEER